ncbi:MAG: hypothetical protein ACK4GD_12445 [Sphingomonadaceae bacterium]
MADALQEAEDYLKGAGLLNSPGAVLYSSAKTLAQGPVYLLGLNPGGTEGATLQDSIHNARRDHNCYLDEQWSPRGHLQPRGQAVLQRRVQNLCALMGLETRDVPASNLVFTRSTRTGTHLDFKGALPLCLPVHKIFIRAIEPDFLMTFGALDNFGSAVQIESVESRLAEHGTWEAHRGFAQFEGRRIAFGNIPHMSLWASDKRQHIVKWALANMVGA